MKVTKIVAQYRVYCFNELWRRQKQLHQVVAIPRLNLAFFYKLLFRQLDIDYLLFAQIVICSRKY